MAYVFVAARDSAAFIILFVFSVIFAGAGVEKAHAQSEQVTGATMTLEVQNSFTFVEAVTADTGINAVFADLVGTDVSTIQLTPAGVLNVTPNGNSNAIVVDDTGVAPGRFDITGAAPNTTLNISFINIVNLSCASCSPGNPVFVLSGLNTSVGMTPTTDVNGDLSFTYGFTLTTQPGPPDYQNGQYAGGFDIEVSY